MTEPLYGFNDMDRQPDGSYRYRGNVGTSVIGQAKLAVREFEDKYDEYLAGGDAPMRADFERWADDLAGHLWDVLAESDRRLFESTDTISHRVISWIVRKFNR